LYSRHDASGIENWIIRTVTQKEFDQDPRADVMLFVLNIQQEQACHQNENQHVPTYTTHEFKTDNERPNLCRVVSGSSLANDKTTINSISSIILDRTQLFLLLQEIISPQVDRRTCMAAYQSD
jgi:hypothetical protein